jgi:hypothetical protein
MGFIYWKMKFGKETYVFIGGTGGGCFRYMYSRFLKEAAAFAHRPGFKPIAQNIKESGELLSEIGLMFKDAEKMNNVQDSITKAGELFLKIADIEEQAFTNLGSIIKG